jgi:DNA-binding transcriptional MerR regulator
MKKYYTTGEAAQMLGIGIHTVRYYIKAMGMDVMRRSRSKYRMLTKSQVEALEAYKNRDEAQIRIDDQEEETMLTSGIL